MLGAQASELTKLIYQLALLAQEETTDVQLL